MTQVPSAADCANAKNGSWYYDWDTPVTIAVHLCPCDSYARIDASRAVPVVLLTQCEKHVEVI